MNVFTKKIDIYFFPNCCQGGLHLIPNINCVSALLLCNSATSVLEPWQGGTYFQIELKERLFVINRFREASQLLSSRSRLIDVAFL